MSRTNALVRSGAAIALLASLSGCVALAVPLLAATGIVRLQTRSRAEIVAALPAANAAALAALPASSGRLTTLTELPPPSGPLAPAAAPWQDFASYALGRAATLAESGDAVSALLTPDSVSNFQNRTRPCPAREAAVVIDLDPAGGIFTPASLGQAAPGIAATAAQLRAAGVIVLWVSQASANDVAGIADALKASGLDPTGADPILLVRNEDERKQVLREEANDTVCVVAIAGDTRSDFDELFDYLRDPRLATAYDGQLGAGWFLVPPLFESAVAPAGEDGSR